MRISPLILVVILLSTNSGEPAAATSVYRCVGDDGIVKFQDMACQSGESSRKILLPEAPPPPVVETNRADRKPPVKVVQSASPRESTPAVEFNVSATLCAREDGSRYLSDSGHGEQRAVPLGMLGVPGDSLVDAYAGRDGIGVSAPGLRTPPVDHSSFGQLGAAYVWVEDPCRRINAGQLCEFLDERIDDAERRLRFAFSDTSAQVREDLESLRRRAKGCPR